MSTPTVPHARTDEKPEPPPIVAMLRAVEASCAERDRLAAERLAALSRTLEGRE